MPKLTNNNMCKLKPQLDTNLNAFRLAKTKKFDNTISEIIGKWTFIYVYIANRNGTHSLLIESNVAIISKFKFHRTFHLATPFYEYNL